MFGIRMFGKRIAALEKAATKEFQGAVSISGNTIGDTINNYGNTFSAVLTGKLKLGVVYVAGEGYKTVLTPEAYLEFPDGKRLPVKFEEFKLQNRKAKENT